MGVRPVLVSVVLAAAVAACQAPTRSKPKHDAPLMFEATAYCIDGTTKSGTRTRVGIVAADPRVLPLGSVVRVDGLPGRHNRIYTVTDTGRAIKGREIDIFMEDCGAARRFGRQQARLRILRVGPDERPSRP